MSNDITVLESEVLNDISLLVSKALNVLPVLHYISSRLNTVIRKWSAAIYNKLYK